jgi:DnaJ-class molecular chaperone
MDKLVYKFLNIPDIIKSMENCPDCGGSGYVKDKNGVHTCWKCLEEGKLEQHSEKVKDSGIEI